MAQKAIVRRMVSEAKSVVVDLLEYNRTVHSPPNSKPCPVKCVVREVRRMHVSSIVAKVPSSKIA